MFVVKFRNHSHSIYECIECLFVCLFFVYGFSCNKMIIDLLTSIETDWFGIRFVCVCGETITFIHSNYHRKKNCRTLAQSTKRFFFVFMCEKYNYILENVPLGSYWAFIYILFLNQFWTIEFFVSFFFENMTSVSSKRRQKKTINKIMQFNNFKFQRKTSFFLFY